MAACGDVTLIAAVSPPTWAEAPAAEGNSVMEMPTDLNLGQAHLRIARLSADLATVVKFYRDGLGFSRF